MTGSVRLIRSLPQMPTNAADNQPVIKGGRFALRRMLMRVLIATDAWHPQINGVVRTLTSLEQAAKGLGVSIECLTPEGFPTVPLPTYANLRPAIPNSSEIA